MSQQPHLKPSSFSSPSPPNLQNPRFAPETPAWALYHECGSECAPSHRPGSLLEQQDPPNCLRHEQRNCFALAIAVTTKNDATQKYTFNPALDACQM
uniref:Uncharacterized protein n=1 Tax=Mycena chlorophos TaxID=658473 RepID=A0ABQ0L3B5_MYCCL|nr:predicted protein [Mycena chlorophos]